MSKSKINRIVILTPFKFPQKKEEVRGCLEFSYFLDFSLGGGLAEGIKR